MVAVRNINNAVVNNLKKQKKSEMKVLGDNKNIKKLVLLQKKYGKINC